MSKSERKYFIICHEPDGWLVRVPARRLRIFGPIFGTFEEAKEQVRKCEQDEEYAYWQEVYALGATPNPMRARFLMRNMSKYEKMVLIHLSQAFYRESNVFTFQGLADALDITVRQAKTAARALKRRGYAEHTAYWNDDGVIGGSGYEVTLEGLSVGKKLADEAKPKTSDSIAEFEATL